MGLERRDADLSVLTPDGAETVLANATLVLRDEAIRGSVTIRDGRIAAIDPGASVPPGAVDLEGEYLAPGLIELHTDNLERHMTPRPGVKWPLDAAVLAHDAELASVGVTTVFDALRVGSIPSASNGKYEKYARFVADHILALRGAGHLRISHYLHLRAEICSETLLEELAEFHAGDRIGIVSLMDHTPGQRQFRDISKYEEYLSGKHGMTGPEMDAYFVELKALSKRVGARHEAGAAEIGKRLGATLASHDDTTESDVATSIRHGVRLAEFPTTLEAARASHTAGVAVIMGAPNLLRGGSHSGNVAASELAEEGVLDILSSDYAPSSLLMAAVRLGLESGDMAAGLRTVTAAPAKAAGLTDRGVIEIGKRADLIRFGVAGDLPVVRSTWTQGHKA
jgi:alpha-D-ribose 1-methylphosphonate 5-triphosphate diphosphatase